MKYKNIKQFFHTKFPTIPIPRDVIGFFYTRLATATATGLQKKS